MSLIIDATQHHDPAKAPGLVAQAIDVAGSQIALARRTGLSREYLRRLASGDGQMSYGVQVMLEAIIREG